MVDVRNQCFCFLPVLVSQAALTEEYLPKQSVFCIDNSVLYSDCKVTWRIFKEVKILLSKNLERKAGTYSTVCRAFFQKRDDGIFCCFAESQDQCMERIGELILAQFVENLQQFVLTLCPLPILGCFRTKYCNHLFGVLKRLFY